MGILDGQLASAIYAGFKGKLKTGTLRKMVRSESGGLDAKGDPIAAAPVTYGFEGFTDLYSAFYKAQAGIPASDLKVCIFGKSLPAGIVPGKDDKALISGVWYQLRQVGVDPAGALYECQAFQCGAPS